MTRDEAIDTLETIISWEQFDFYDEEKEALEMALEALKQPEIVHCKDCIHSSGVKMVDGWTYCAEGRLLVKYEDGYCSDARRREE